MATEYWNEQGNDGEQRGTLRKNGLLRVVYAVTSISNTSLNDALEVPFQVGGTFSFNCSAKSLPSISERPNWTIHSDMDETRQIEGTTYSGIPETIEGFEITTRTPLSSTLIWLNRAMTFGYIGDVTFTYDDPSQNIIAIITIRDCEIASVRNEGGDNNASSHTTIKFQPMGTYLPSVTTYERTEYLESNGSQGKVLK